MAVVNSLQMLKTVIMDFTVIKPHFSWRLSRLFFSASSRLSRIFRGRLAGLAQIAAGGRLSRRLRGLANTPKRYRQLRVKDLSRVLTWRLEWHTCTCTNLIPSEGKAPNH